MAHDELDPAKGAPAEAGDDTEAGDTAENEDGDSLLEEDKMFPDDEEDGKKDTEEKDDTEDKKGKGDSAIHQKKYWRGKYRELKAELDSLRTQKGAPADKGGDTPEARKEQAAKDVVKKIALEAVREMQQAEAAEAEKKTDEFEEALDAVLEDHDDVTEKELLDICEKYEVSPANGYKIFKDTKSAKPGKPKPKLPQPKDGGEEITEPKDAKGNQKRRTWEDTRREAIALAKKLL